MSAKADLVAALVSVDSARASVVGSSRAPPSAEEIADLRDGLASMKLLTARDVQPDAAERRLRVIDGCPVEWAESPLAVINSGRGRLGGKWRKLGKPHLPTTLIVDMYRAAARVDSVHWRPHFMVDARFEDLVDRGVLERDCCTASRSKGARTLDNCLNSANVIGSVEDVKRACMKRMLEEALAMGDSKTRDSFPSLATFRERIMKNRLFQFSNVTEEDMQMASQKKGFEKSIGKELQFVKLALAGKSGRVKVERVLEGHEWKWRVVPRR